MAGIIVGGGKNLESLRPIILTLNYSFHVQNGYTIRAGQERNVSFAPEIYRGEISQNIPIVGWSAAVFVLGVLLQYTTPVVVLISCGSRHILVASQ